MRRYVETKDDADIITDFDVAEGDIIRLPDGVTAVYYLYDGTDTILSSDEAQNEILAVLQGYNPAMQMAR